MEQKKLFFQKLTPTDEVKISVYEEAIDFVFANEDITNIAISGPYSAGNENINDDTKIRYIEVLKTVISDITQIENVALWKSLVQKDILSHTAINIVTYYLEKGMDNDIVCFINKSDLGIDFSHVEEQFGEKDTSIFYDDIAKNNDIKSNIYKKILNDQNHELHRHSHLGVGAGRHAQN